VLRQVRAALEASPHQAAGVNRAGWMDAGGRVWWGGGSERECPDSGVDDAAGDQVRADRLDLFFSRGNGTKQGVGALWLSPGKDHLQPRWSKLTTPKYPGFLSSPSLNFHLFLSVFCQLGVLQLQ
jgi:hypothetical protein